MQKLPDVERCVYSDFCSSRFLNDFWQKKPLVISGMFPDSTFMEPDELAGLACEPDVESRIIKQVKKDWSVEHGPFDEDRFTHLPKQDWTLLVQAVDHWVPEVEALLGSFGFLPRWRLDDVMVSYAPTGGTVAQHYDFFDVFLVQGEGSRRWQLGDFCSLDTKFILNLPVRLLERFEPSQEVVLKPGDVLYVPAKLSHYGVSLEDSMTYSVGFRAPSIRDIVDGIATASMERLFEDQRYQDTLESLMVPQGCIPEAAIDTLQAMLQEALLDKNLIAQWFGEAVTEPKYPELESERFDLSDDELSSIFDDESELCRNPSSRFAYTSMNGDFKDDAMGQAQLFVDGVVYETSKAFAELLCDAVCIENANLQKLIGQSKEDLEIVKSLIEKGSLVLQFGES